MASKAVIDFLTKEVKASGNIVTFRLLSRQLSIHVAEAKRELELYYEAAKRNKEPVFATYVLTGVAAPQPRDGSTEPILRHLIVLVGEEEVDAAKSKFIDPPSQHVYSISPVALKDHGLLTSVADRVRQLDKQKGQAHAAQVGMLLSEQAPWPQAGESKLNHANTSSKKDTSAPNTKKSEPATKPQALDSNTKAPIAKEGARQGALNFGPKKSTSESKPKETQPDKSKEKKASTAKPTVVEKSVKKEEPTSRKPTPQAEYPKEISKPPSAASSKGSIAEPSKPVATSRNTGGRSKRVLDSDEEEPPQNHSRPAIKRKKSRVAVEDKDDDESADAGLQAMMDIDDDNVVDGRKTREVTPEHVPSAREVAAAAKAAKIEASKGVDQKQRSSHRRVPKGKKRVMKTRRVKNAKGYMVTEDYSSYEDADPNDTEKGDDTDIQSETDYGDDIDVDVSGKVVSGKSSKPPAKGSSAPQPKHQQSSSSSNTKPKKGKSNDATKPGQPKLASFFGKKQ